MQKLGRNLPLLNYQGIIDKSHGLGVPACKEVRHHGRTKMARRHSHGGTAFGPRHSLENRKAPHTAGILY